MANKTNKDAIKLTTPNFKAAVIAFKFLRFQANNTKKHKACNSKLKKSITQLLAIIEENIPNVAKLTTIPYS